MRQQIKHALQAISRLHGVNHPIVCGGYARDLILSKSPRDIDIFLPGWTTDHPSIQEIANGVLGLGFKVDRIRLGFYGRTHGCIYCHADKLDINIVPHYGTTPKEITATFDYNICRFWIDYLGDMKDSQPDHMYVEGRDRDYADLMALNMRLMHTHTPRSSLRRGFLFEHRLGFKFQPRDLRRLVTALYKRKAYGS